MEEIIKKVLYNPQVSHPPISYEIADIANTSDEKSYKSQYIDIKDFQEYLKRLEKQLIYRLKRTN